MDSSAFSMHFQSLARSDSEDMKTSTRVHLSFEEKTPTPSSVPSDTRNYMQLTLVNKRDSDPDVSISNTSTGSPSNDMSLVGQYHDKYDYGKLLPVLDPLLAEEDQNDLQVVSHISVLKSPIKDGKQNENGSDVMDFSYNNDNKWQEFISHEDHEEVSDKRDEMTVADDGYKPLLTRQNEFGVLSNTSDTQASKPLTPNQSIRGALTVKTNHPVKDAFGISSGLELLATNQGTPSNYVNMPHQLNNVKEKENKSPSAGSITHLTNTPNYKLLNGVGLFKSPGTVTPLNNQTTLTRRASVSSLQKSISKLRILEASPFSAALNAKLEDSTSRSLVGLSKMTPLGNLSEKDGATTNMDDNKTITYEGCFADVASQVVPSSAGTCSGEHMQQNLLKAADTKSGHEDIENTNISPQTYNSSIKKLKKASTARFRISPYGDVKQPSQHDESLKFGSGHVVGLAIASDAMDSMGIKGRESSSPLNGAGSSLEEMLYDKKDVHNNSETNGDLSKDIQHDNSVLREYDISMGQINTSLVLNGKMDEKSCHKNLADQFGIRPCMLNNDNIDSFHAENIHSDVSSAERKRKAEHEAAEKIAKVKLCSDSDLELPSDCEMSSMGPNLEHLAKIHTRFFKETKLLSHSVDKMNLHAIDHMVDILGQLQRSKTYQLLSNDMQSKDKRAAEIRLILCKFVHEQAKLQLMHVKRERLMKNVQSLASGIQESETLKLNHSQQNSLDVQIINHQPLPDNSMDIQECQVDDDTVTSMRQAGKEIDNKISNLTKSFHTMCKMKGEPKNADTIAFANNYLMKKARSQIIRKDLQLWVLDDLKNSKDHHDVVLNYLDLLSQRLTVTAGLVPCSSISNILNQRNIEKNFKDIDASTAFGFVFDAGLLQKHVSATSLAQATQITTSLLGNLVDVMEEIQLARIELKNLIYARFHTSSEERLDLELYFFDTNSRQKATVTLNTSCLRRGIYPSETASCQIDSTYEKLSAEIAGAVQGLGVGFLRILRLCRCISQLVGLQGKN
ncbi:hypothetical protein M8C21_015057 [Ambrosia artemisiifolia]|uniref:Knl1 C-terminal RWD domain-containing protein n=1 Tax=Ambrosia artemisiifolia TaxID=4212 RepID=A0AAD5D1B1_AMBAR|nr:hypothetical protein M8C21_015057 [Ambrosia artemisiifolia]